MEKCYNCKKETVTLICTICEVGVCMWCFGCHYNHDLKNIKDYLRELLSTRKVDFDRHAEYTTRANDLKASLELSMQMTKEPDEFAKIQKQHTELTKYINEVDATSEYLEQLSYSLESTVIDYPMTFIEKIKNIKIDIRIPEYMKELKNELKEVQIVFNRIDEKQFFKNFIKLKVKYAMDEMIKRIKAVLLHLEAGLIADGKINVKETMETLKVYFKREEEELVACVLHEFDNLHLADMMIDSFNVPKKTANEYYHEGIMDEIKEAEEKIAAMKADHQNLITQIEEAQNYLAQQKKEIAEMKLTKDELLEANKKRTAANAELSKNSQKLKDKLLDTESNYNTMQTNYANLIDKISKESNKLETLLEEIKIQEGKCNEAKSLYEYKKESMQKITSLTEILNKYSVKNKKFQNQLKGLKNQVIEMGGAIKKLVSIFHRRWNTLQKAVQQIIMDLHAGHVSKLQEVRGNIFYNKNYRERMKPILIDLKEIIKTFRGSVKEFKSTKICRENSLKVQESVKPLRVFLNETALFAKTLKDVCKMPLTGFETLTTPKLTKELRSAFKEIIKSVRELKFASSNTNKQITELEAKREKVKKKLESMLKNNEEGWDLCEAKETNIKEDIIEIIKCYLQIK